MKSFAIACLAAVSTNAVALESDYSHPWLEVEDDEGGLALRGGDRGIDNGSAASSFGSVEGIVVEAGVAPWAGAPASEFFPVGSSIGDGAAAARGEVCGGA